jgi:hypothetical protein
MINVKNKKYVAHQEEQQWSQTDEQVVCLAR